jgi:hypothetical protein
LKPQRSGLHTRTSQPTLKATSPPFRRFGKNAYRHEPSGADYASVKNSDKQFRRSLRTTDRKLAEHRLPDLRQQVGNLSTEENRNVGFVELADRWLETVQPADLVIGIKSARKCLETACRHMGFPAYSHHDFRHFFATTGIEAGVDIPTVSRWLGHKDGGALAMKVYGHLRQEHSFSQIKLVSFGSPAKPASADATTQSGG